MSKSATATWLVSEAATSALSSARSRRSPFGRPVRESSVLAVRLLPLLVVEGPAQGVRLPLRQPQLALRLREAHEALDAEGDHAPIEGALDEVGDSRVQGRPTSRRLGQSATTGTARPSSLRRAWPRARRPSARRLVSAQTTSGRRGSSSASALARIVGRGHLEAGAGEPAAGLLAAPGVEPDEQPRRPAASLACPGSASIANGSACSAT